VSHAREAAHRALDHPGKQILSGVLAIAVAFVLGERRPCLLLQARGHDGRHLALYELLPAVDVDPDLVDAGVGALADDARDGRGRPRPARHALGAHVAPPGRGDAKIVEPLRFPVERGAFRDVGDDLAGDLRLLRYDL
jgi:hypothetical protein